MGIIRRIVLFLYFVVATGGLLGGLLALTQLRYAAAAQSFVVVVPGVAYYVWVGYRDAPDPAQTP